MDNLESLTSKLNQVQEKSNIFFISSEIERGLGLEKILSNFHLICYFNDNIYKYLKKNNFKVFSLEEVDKLAVKSSARILTHASVKEYIQTKGIGYAQTFKISEQFEEEVLRQSLISLNTPSRLNRLFEDKISQYNELKDTYVLGRQSNVVKLGEKTFEDLVKEFKLPFVVQFSKGHTGSGTKIIDNKNSFLELAAKFPDREARISEFVDSQYVYTVNGCITKYGNFFGGLSFQITGTPELTNLQGATVGNDFSVRDGISDIAIVENELKKIADIMKNKGFRGLFGVDFMMKDDKFNLIEINARQTASIAMHTKIQLRINQIPLSMLHLAEFMNIQFEVNESEYNKINLAPIEASQVFIRAQEDLVLRGSINDGIYKLQSDNAAMEVEKSGEKNKIVYLDEERDRPLILQKEGYSIDEITEEGGMLILSRPVGEEIGTGSEIARIQTLRRSLDSNLKPLPVITQSLVGVKNYLI